MFYVDDVVDIRWSIVILTNKITDHHNQDHEDTDIGDDPYFGTSQSFESTDPTIDDIMYMKDSHSEGIWTRPVHHSM